jgi:Ca2+-binding RTX toxin-like protein
MVHNLTVRFNSVTSNFEILDGVAVVTSGPAATTTGITVNGADSQDDILTVQIPTAVPLPPVNFNGGLAGHDRIVVSADLNFVLDNSHLSLSNGANIFLNGVEEASLTGGPGNNKIDASAFTGNTTLSGGAGNDTLIGGSGIDSMLGGPGDDLLQSLTGGDDQLQGGTGNDYYLISPHSNPVITDDGGNDVVDLSRIPDSGVQVTLGGSSGSITELLHPDRLVTINGSIETLIGTNFDDTIYATNTTLPALVQNIIGGPGNDTLIDQSTASQLNLYGDNGPGMPVTGTGNDTYELNGGGNVVIGDSGGTDTLDFSSVTSSGANVTLGDTSATATVGATTVTVSGTIENVVGTNFNDRIIGNSVNNSLFGGLGNDYLDGGAGNDVVNGGPGDDTILGGPGDDTLIGGGGNDSFNGGTGNDVYQVVPNSSFVFTDSGGIDTLDFSHALRGIKLNLGSSGNQTIDSHGSKVKLNGTFENVIGTPFDDHINGNAADNVLVGGGGNDFLDGQGGRDILIGGTGEDHLIGSAGEDILIGGTTDFDTDAAALAAIQAEWSSSRDYLTRVNNIRGITDVGPRLNGSYVLTTTGPNATVHDDGSVDKLTGSQDNDWYFVSAGDVVTDKIKDEQIN